MNKTFGTDEQAGSSPVSSDEETWTNYHAFMQQNLRKNYTVNLIHGVFGMTGFRLIYAPTIIPAYLFVLTGSTAAVGLGTALLQLGGIMSPVMSGAYIESRNRILPYAIRVGSLMRVMVLALAIVAWLLDGPLLLWSTLIIFFLLGFFQGGQRVAFNILMAKVIPINRRGRLQGIRNMVGGLVAAGLAWLAGHYFIENKWLGNGYATTFLLAFVLTSVGLFVLQFGIVEPDSPRTRRAISVRERFGQFRELVSHGGFRGFLWAHALGTVARVGLPFWTLFVGDRLGLSGTLVGSLSLAFLAADTMSNLLWGPIGDRLGFRIVYVGGLVTGLAGMVLLVLGQDWMLYAAFVALGCSFSGTMMATQTMVLEFGLHEDVPMRMALINTVEAAVSCVGPLLAGVAIGIFGYTPLIVITFVALAIGLAIILLCVREPRLAHRAGD